MGASQRRPGLRGCRHAHANLGKSPLQIRAFKVNGFRNLEPTVLEPGPRFNVLHGDNGQGKTNILEALYTVCALRSFRARRLAELIRLGEERAYVAARVHRDGLERLYELTIAVGSRSPRLDGKVVRPVANYFGQFNVVLFAPEDLQIPRASPSDRRRFLDRAIFGDTPHFLQLAQDYEKVLRNRNALLRDEAGQWTSQKETLLDVLDEQLARLAARLTLHRQAFLGRLQPAFTHAYEEITRSGLVPALRYQTEPELLAGLANDSNQALPALESRLVDLTRASRRRDRARGSTSVGPHRHDLEFLLEGQPAATFASQGQLRAMILAWKTAETTLLAETRGDPPILLLDDVSSELDPSRNHYLFDFLRQQRCQCFITTTHPKHVLLSGERVDYDVRSGSVTCQNK